MKRKTWLAALLTLCLITLPALTALADETGMESLDEIGAEVVDEIIADPVDEITAEAVDQDIDTVTMDLDDADGQGDADRQGNSDDQGDADDQSALLPEFTAVDAPATDPAHETTPDGSADAASDGNTDAASDGNTDAASDGNTDAAGDIPAADDALAADESDAVNSPASDNAPFSGEPAAPAEPLSASLEPEPEQFSAAAMLAGDGIIGTITDDCISAIEPVTYNGNPQTPEVVVTVNCNRLTLNTDYTVEYMDNINAGEAWVYVAGTGNYDGSVSATFTINKADRTVTASYTGEVPDKVYDKTRNLPMTFTFNSSDFRFSNVADGDTVAFDPDATDNEGNNILSAGYDGVNVGAHKVNITLAIKYTSTNYNYKLANSTITSNNSGNITPKQLTIRPGEEINGTLVPQTKVYGAADPSSYKAKVAGVLEGDKLADAVSGELSRQPGENVGNYRITIGTVKTKGNYATDPNLEEGYFEITTKPITASDIGIGSIPNQSYTASPIEPAITVTYGSMTLVQGTDFDVTFSNNVLPGIATATITGKGNYTGTRTASFRIVQSASMFNVKLQTSGTNQYTGAAIEPEVIVTFKREENGNTVEETLVRDTDYDVVYENNVEPGIATITVSGKGDYSFTRAISFAISRVSLISTDVHISLNTIEPYTGSAIEPNPTVTFNKSENGSVTQKTLVRGTDYYIIYDNNIKPGPATITVVGKGYYEGARTVVFNIVDDASSSGSPKVEGPDEGIPIVASAGAASAPAPAAAAPAAQNVIPATSTTRTSVSAAPGSVYQLDLGGQAGTKFKSSNSKVATVDQNGNVTFKKPGKVKITFKVGRKKRTVTLKVTDPTVPASVALTPVNTAVKKGDVVTLTPSVPGNANPGGYNWKSSNKKVATVKNGVVTFKKPGRVTITCTAKRGKKKARVKFRVSK